MKRLSPNFYWHSYIARIDFSLLFGFCDLRRFENFSSSRYTRYFAIKLLLKKYLILRVNAERHFI